MAASVLAERYRLQETLSATGMAEVRLAVDLALDRRVVVKLLAPNADRARFEREARAAAALAHPNIVQLFDFGTEAERPYMVFEYLSGGSLEDRLSDTPVLPHDQTARVAADVAAGLAHAHKRGVVHRDLKPANILFDSEDRAKIADLGIASLQGADTLTDAGTVLGTAAYISPEQTRSEPATPASDVYSYGVVLYRLLAGRLPFESASAAELCAMHREAPPPPLAAGSEQLAALAMAALAKSPAERPADGGALLCELAAPHAAETQVMRARPPRRRFKPTPLAGALALVLLAGAGVLTAAVVTNDPAPAPATPARSSTAEQTRTTSPSRPTTARSTSILTASTTTATRTSTPRATTSTPRTTTTSETTTEPVATATTSETAVPAPTTTP
jgi:eukaryotic-like serine/threonine-protein kinase